MFDFSRDEFIKYMDDYPVFRTAIADNEPMIKYQYSSSNVNHFDKVADLVILQGFDGDYYYWISKKDNHEKV